MTVLHVAVLERSQQQKRADAALKRACPVGSEVVYQWGAHAHLAEVVMHGAGLRLFVRNKRTHGARWIGCYLLAEFIAMDRKYGRGPR